MANRETVNNEPSRLLKNFSAFEPLEPQKVPNYGTTVDKLIDIDDDSNVPNSDTAGSLYDPSRSYDLVDLYQNIFVTAQHLANTGPNDIDFTNFLDEIEAIDNTTKHSDDLTKCNSTEHNNGENAAHSSCNTKAMASSRDATPFKVNAMVYDYKDTNIHEINVSVDRKFVSASSQTNSDSINYDLYVKPRVIVPTIDPDSDSDPEELIHQIMSNKNLERNLSRMKSSETKEHADKTLKNQVIDDDKIVETERICNKTHENVQTHNSIYQFEVKTMIKDDKAFKKHRRVVPDHVKVNYVKGPDVNEKRVILPQIMRRLMERQAVMDEEKSWKKRLILDTGSTNSSCPCARIKQDSTLSESKSPRKSLLKEFNIPNASSSPLHTNLMTSCSEILDKNDSFVNSGVMSSHVRSGKGLKMSSFGDKLSTKSFEPVVLMDDCNKERLLAWKQGQFISQLVRTGKYP